MADEILDALPLEMLLALRDAVADPSEEGRLRAAERAADAGFYLVGKNDDAAAPSRPPRVLREPIETLAAPDGVVALTLDFSRGTKG